MTYTKLYKIPKKINFQFNVSNFTIPGSDAISKPLPEVSGLLPRDPFDPGELDAARNDS